MSDPRRPRLPRITPEATTAPGPHPLHHPDERKEGGPDHGKAEKQRENHRKMERDAKTEE